MRPVSSVIGLAGHIDHGKTALVKALTGVDCDTLTEEKRRGVTIDIGFARMDLPDGKTVGIIDAPGHQKFVHNMLAGATGVDVGLLVVAADDAVMPQTVEHLTILELLGIKKLVVALTKIDIVEQDICDLAMDDVKSLLAGSPYKKSAIIACSSVTGAGVDQIKEELTSLCQEAARKSENRYFRMPIDRVFTIRGHGLVVTGTVFSGVATSGDRLLVSPLGDEGRVRNIENYGQTADTSSAGIRTAINFSGLDKSRLTRGMIICHPKISSAHRLFVGSVICHKLSKLRIEHGTAYLFYVHTAERLAKVYLMSGQSLKPGESTIAQIRFDDPLQILNGDQFVLRDSSARHTLGGGVILYPGGPLLGRRGLKAKETFYNTLEDQEKGVVALVASQPSGILLDDISAMFNLPTGNLKNIFRSQKTIDTYEWKGAVYACIKTESVKLVDNIVEAVSMFHDQNQSLLGAQESEIAQTALAEVAEPLTGYWIRRAVSAGKIELVTGLLRLPGRKASFSGADETMRQKIIDTYKSAIFAPPKPNRLPEIFGQDKKDVFGFLRTLTEAGELINLAPDYTVHKDTLDLAKSALVDELDKEGSVTTGRFRDLLDGAGRKAAIEVLEYFDRIGVTKRIDNKGTRVRGPKG